MDIIWVCSSLLDSVMFWVCIIFVLRTMRVYFLIIKPTRCTSFSNLFLEWNSTCCGQFLCPSSGVFHCTHSSDICHTGLLTACKQDQDGASWSCLQAASKPVWHISLLCVRWKTPDDGQRNCLKHVEFYSKNKFEKLVHLVGFIIRNLTQCTVTWTSNLSEFTFHLPRGFISGFDSDPADSKVRLLCLFHCASSLWTLIQ